MMKKSLRAALTFAAAALAWGVSASAQAGTVVVATLDYAPLSVTATAPVPSLGTWGLALMVLFLAVVAYRALRGRVDGRLLTPVLLAGALGAGGLAGHDLVAVANAMTLQTGAMTQAAGGTFNFGDSGMWEITNSSGVPQQVKVLTASESVAFDDPAPMSPQCTVNLVVTPGAKCYVYMRDFRD